MLRLDGLNLKQLVDQSLFSWGDFLLSFSDCGVRSLILFEDHLLVLFELRISLVPFVLKVLDLFDHVFESKLL